MKARQKQIEMNREHRKEAKKYKSSLMMIFIIICLTSCTGMTQNRSSQEVKKEFISEFYDKAYYLKIKYDIPICITLGIAAHESGWNRSTAAKKHNNLFGLRTKNDQEIHFDSMFECFDYFGRLLKFSKTYKDLQECQKSGSCDNYRLYLIKMRECGYNTSLDWPGRIIAVIRSNNFQEL